MKFVSEKVIDEIVEHLDQENTQQYLEELVAQQEEYIRFIASENFKLLAEEEYDVLTFLSIVITKSIKQVNPSIDTLSEELIGGMDEKNWTIYNDEKNFGKVVDKFFENYKQEDLLAFVEDSLQQDEESNLSQVGREIIFITCKSFIDAADFVTEE